MSEEHKHDHVHGPDCNHDHDHDHTHNEERGEQTVTMEDAGPARKCLTIEIPAERIAAKLEAAMGKLKTDAVLPGFRRGRAPMRLIEKRFASSIRDDVRSQLMTECYTQAIQDQKLEVIGDPEIKDMDQIKLPDSGPMTIKVEVEITPSFDMPAFDGLEVKKVKRSVTEADVDAEIERLRERFGKVNVAENASAQEGDYLLTDVRILEGQNAKTDGTQIAHHPNTYVLVNGAKREFKGHVAGIVVNDLGKLMAGKKPGETVEVSLNGPQGHEDERIKDKPITLFIRIDRIERLEPLALDALPAQLGAENLDDLRKQLRELLERRIQGDQQADQHEQLCTQMLEKVTLDLPQGLSRRQAARLLQRQAVDMAMRGVPEPQIEQKIAELRAGSEVEAARQLKLFFIITRAAKELGVEVSENEVNSTIAMMAMQQGRRPEKLRQQLVRSGQIEQIYLEVRDRKTLDKILEKAKVTEVDPPADAQAKK